MKGFLPALCCLATFVFACQSIHARPASDRLMTLSQPDSTEFSGRRRGDEFFHWFETPAGYPIVKDPISKIWYYSVKTETGADTPSDRVVGRDAPPEPAPWEPVTPSEAVAASEVPRTGMPSVPDAENDSGFLTGTTWKIPVLLGTFSDRVSGIHTPRGTTSEWEELLFNNNPAKGRSVRKLFHEMSGGKVTVTSGPEKVKGWFVAPHSHDHYGGNAEGIENEQGYYFVRDIVAAADSTFDFGPYDTDNDGYVDVVAIIHQGTGEADSDTDSDIWPHQSTLEGHGTFPFNGPYNTNDRNALGNFVKVNRYIIQNGQDPVDPIMATIGTFCHELGHAAGLPDLYARGKNRQSQALGSWCLMASGCNNGIVRSGDSPAWANPWCRAKLGWVTPIPVNLNQIGQKLEAVNNDSGGSVLRIPAAYNQYFLVEMRARKGFDSALPGDGILIWHVDENVTTQNDVRWWPPTNTHKGHQLIALEQSDGNYDLERGNNGGDDTDPYGPGKEFSVSTSPSSRAYNVLPATGEGADTFVALKNFKRLPDDWMEFDVFRWEDTVAPGITIDAPVEGVAGESISSFVFTATENRFSCFVAAKILEDKPGGRWWNQDLQAWESPMFHSYYDAEHYAIDGNWRIDVNSAAFGRGQFILYAFVQDLAGNRTEVIRKFSLQDLTPPDVAITAPVQDSEILPPVTVTGTASDNIALKEKRVALYNMDAGGWYVWNSAPANFTTPFSHVSHARTVDGAATPWSLPLPVNLPFGHYQVHAQAVDMNDLGSAWKSVSFLLGKTPSVTISTPTHNSMVRGFPALTGFVTDPGGTGILGNLVTITIYQDGEYWNGSAWQTDSASVAATVQPNGSWTYTGTAPTRDGQMIVSAGVQDNSGNVAKRIGPGLPGANSVIFKTDSTPPELRIDSPLATATVTSAPLPAKWMRGFARDNMSATTVRVSLRRLSDDSYWDGAAWNPAQATRLAAFSDDGDGGSKVSWFWANRQPALGRDLDCMTNGSYRITAVATDSVGNSRTESVDVTVDWQPMWLRPQDQLARLLPEQKIWPIHDATVAATVTHTVTPPEPVGPYDTPNPAGLGFDASGVPVVAFAVANIDSVTIADGISQRLGSNSWTRRRQTYLESFQPPGGEPTASYYEKWSDGEAPTLISLGEYYARFAKAAVDDAGSTYEAYVLRRLTFMGWSDTTGLLLIKFDANGNRVWRQVLSLAGTDIDFFGGFSAQHMLQPQADGSLICTDVVGGSTSRFIHISPAGSVLRNLWLADFGDGEENPGQAIVARFVALDGSGHAFLGTDQTDVGSTCARQVVRKIDLATGEVSIHREFSTCETPEVWQGLKTDADGNLYSLSAFSVTETDARVCLTKFDNDLNMQWRAFGPPKSAYPEGGVWFSNQSTSGMLQVTPQGITAITHLPFYGFEGVGEYKEGALLFCRFSADGALEWSRAVQSGNGGGYTQMTDYLVGAEMDPTGAILFLANFVVDPNNAISEPVYGKISNAGDLQFIKKLGGQFFFSPCTALDSSGRLVAFDYTPVPERQLKVTVFDNPGSVLAPVLLDSGIPGDQTLITGATMELSVVNRGSAATYQWFKEDLSGTPQEIVGATSDKLVIQNVQVSDGGEYSVAVTNGLGTKTSRTAVITVLDAVDLADALDTPGRTWTTGGDAPWVGYSPTPTHDGVDAAMPGNIGHAKTSWLETKITGPGTVTFWWKTSTQMFGDVLEFSVDGEVKAMQHGEWDWQVVTVDFEGAGEHTLRWAYVKDSDTVGGLDRVWLDEVSFSTPLPLDVALDTPGRTWDLSGDANWTGTTSPSHDGVDAAVSGAIIGNQETSMQTTVTGPGTLSFWWKVSSEDGFDFLKLTVDNVTYASTTGIKDWTKITRPISGEGEHTLKWTYSKDPVFNAGQDRGWVDQVVFTPEGPAPPVAQTLPASHISNQGARLNGQVNPSSLATTVSFEYGLMADELTSSTTVINISAGTSDVPVAQSLSGLEPDTEYFFRLKATNAQDTSYGDTLSFTTGGDPDIVVEETGGGELQSGDEVLWGDSGVGSVLVKEFVIRNGGTGPLDGLEVSFVGAQAGDFALISPLLPVPAGEETTLRVRFIAGGLGLRAAALQITSNDPDENPFALQLKANGAAPPAGAEIEVEHPLFSPLADNASTVDFGSVALTGSTPLSITIRNIGSAKLTGVAAAMAGDHPANFVLTSKPTTSVAAKATSTFIVSFKPSALGERKAVLKIASNDAGENPFEINLIGEGHAPAAPEFTVSPVSQMLPVGAMAVFDSEAGGDPEPAYQWRKGAASVTGAKSKSYVIPSVALTHAGMYRADATNSAGHAHSDWAELGVVEVAPRTHIVSSGGNLSFTANAAGNQLSYVWKCNGMALVGSSHYVDINKKTLQIKGLQPADNGVYSCEVTGAAGVLSSGGQTVVVFTGKPDITPLTTGGALPAGIVSRPYSYQVPFDSAADKTPTGFTAAGLPPGLTMGKTGLISGTPTAAKTGAGGVVVSYSVKITASNSKGKDEVTVNLLIAPLPAGALGKFEGPIARSPLNGNLGGRFDLETKAAGTFTGKIAMGAATYGFTGKLASDAAGLFPQATVPVVVNKVTLFTVTFTVDTANSRIDAGSISNGAGAVAFTAWRKTWTTAVTPVGLTGYYTFALDMPGAEPQVPRGKGYGMLTVNAATGALALKIRTADDETVLATPVLGPQGQVLVHQLLYGTTKGSLTGSLMIGKGVNAGDDSDNTLAVALSASRPADSPAKTRKYTGGFGPLDLVMVAGGRFVQPPLVLGVTAGSNNAQLVFSEAGIGNPAPGPDIVVGIGAANAITYPNSNPRMTSLKLTPKTGEFSGSFTLDNPPAAKRVVTYQGVIVPQGGQQRGYGFFMLPKLPEAGPPATTPASSPILSGQVVFERP